MMNKRMILTILTALSLIGASIFGMPMSTYADDSTSVLATVEWIGKARDEAVIYLVADRVRTGESYTLNADNEWKHTFTGLSVYNSDGSKIEYSVEEDSIDGYTTVVRGYAETGFTVVNTQLTSVSVTKKWVGDTGTSATIHLLADGEEVDSYTLPQNNGWSYSFSGLAKCYVDEDDNLRPIEYTITEDPVKGYTTEITGDATNGYVVTNIKTIDIPVKKVWYGDAADFVTVHLLSNKEQVDGQTLTLNSDMNWEAAFTAPKYDSDGNDITGTYTVSEDALDGYETEITGSAEDGFTVTNTKLIDVSVTKKWVGDPADSVTVNLLANGTEYQSCTLTEDDNWTYTFTVPQMVDWVPAEYTVTEDELDGYTTEITGNMTDGFVITNTETSDDEDVPVSTPDDADEDDDDDDDESTPSDADEDDDDDDVSTPSDADDEDLSDDDEIINDLPHVNTPSDATSSGSSGSSNDDDNSGSGSSGGSGNSSSSTSSEDSVTYVDPINTGETREPDKTSDDVEPEGVLPKTGEPMSVFAKFVMHLFYGMMNLKRILF